MQIDRSGLLQRPPHLQQPDRHHSAPAAFPTTAPPSCTGTTASLPVGPNPPPAKPGTRPAAHRRSNPPMPRPNPTAPGFLERRSGPSPAHRRAAVPLAVEPRLQLNQVNRHRIQPPQHVQNVPGPNASLSEVGHCRNWLAKFSDGRRWVQVCRFTTSRRIQERLDRNTSNWSRSFDTNSVPQLGCLVLRPLAARRWSLSWAIFSAS